jgi:mono/diheme cytochrome c family protein
MCQRLNYRKVAWGYDQDHKGRGMTSIRISARQLSQAIFLAAALVPWAVTATSADSAAGPSPQVRRGEQIAQERCSACHIVADKQEYPVLLKVPTPSFQSIADRPETSEKKLRQFVATTHWDMKTVPISMPHPELSKAEAAAVIRYILSLKGH